MPCGQSYVPRSLFNFEVSLQPLWSSFLIYAKKKLQLRKSALRSFWPEHSLVIKLMASNPLSEELFEKEAVEEVICQAERQAKSVLSILGTRPSGTKRAASVSTGRTPKRQRLQQGSGQDSQTPLWKGSGYRREDKPTEERFRARQSSPNRCSRTPRRNAKSPRGRYVKTLGTPKRATQSNQGTGSNFRI